MESLLSRGGRSPGWLAGALLFLLPLLLAAQPGPSPDGPRVIRRDLGKPIIFAAQEEYPPYSFRGADGKLKGFATELVDAICEAKGLKIQRVGVPADRMKDDLAAGRVDVIQIWAETTERRQHFDLSVPIFQFETIILVREDDRRIRKASDLKGLHVAVGQSGTSGEEYLRREQPQAIPVYTKSMDEFLRRLSAGEGIDAAVLSRLTAVIAMERLHLHNLRILEERLPDSARVRYCMVTRKGDTDLLANLNEGLSIVRATGRYDEIYGKWFNRYVGRKITALQYVSYTAGALALICVGATWGFFRQRILRQRVVRQSAELAEQRSLLAALYDRHPLATLVLEIAEPSRPVTVVSYNREAARLFSLHAQPTPGQALIKLGLSTEHRRVFEDAVSRWRRGSPATQWELPVPACQQLLEISIVPLGSRGQGAQGLCVLAADITKRRSMDQELAKSRRLRALGELVGGIAHEFNNLLTPIIATTGMLKADCHGSSSALAHVDLVEQAARRAADLTRRLLTFGRKTDDASQPVRVCDIVLNCETLLRTMVDRRIEWKNDLPADLPPIPFNPTDLNQIIFNLVINARDSLVEKLAHPPSAAWHPRIEISVTELAPEAHMRRHSLGNRRLVAWQLLTVADNGMGIPPEIVDRVFEPFFTTKDVGKGTGLGLSTVWHQVVDAGGDVRVQSKPGEGATFHVFLPRWETALRPPPAASLHPVRPAKPGGRLLVVDDEALVARTTASALQRCGYEVDVHTDSITAWEHFKRADTSRFDALLFDLSMPGLGGIDLVRNVRTTAYAGKIVILSGRVSEEDESLLRSLGVTCVLPKPFTLEQLTQTLSETMLAKPD